MLFLLRTCMENNACVITYIHPVQSNRQGEPSDTNNPCQSVCKWSKCRPEYAQTTDYKCCRRKIIYILTSIVVCSPTTNESLEIMANCWHQLCVPGFSVAPYIDGTETPQGFNNYFKAGFYLFYLWPERNSMIKERILYIQGHTMCSKFHHFGREETLLQNVSVATGGLTLATDILWPISTVAPWLCHRTTRCYSGPS
jgi:hypothetical protein